MIFQLGVAIVVGIAIVYQVLYNDITSKLPEYAFLKAMGYHKRYILFIVLQEAIIFAVLGFIPGYTLSWELYQWTAVATGLPIYMEIEHSIFVWLLAIGICLTSGFIAVGKATELDPAGVLVCKLKRI